MIPETLRQLAEKLSGKAAPTFRAVATNLTDLHREPSFLSELLTQITNGTRVQVLEEHEKWCFVRLGDGYLGWAYKAYLAESSPINATHIITAPSPALYAPDSNPPEPAPPLTRLLAGTRVELTKTEFDCAHVRLTGAALPAGWVARQSLRPLEELPLKGEEARRQIIEDARAFRGVYYLWGGGSAWGIDCSGLAQLAHKLAGYEIPRDADMQFAAASAVAEPFQPGDLLFFGEAGGQRKITHVGISTGGWNIIHSSRTRNGVYEENVKDVEHLRNSFIGAGTFVTR